MDEASQAIRKLIDGRLYSYEPLRDLLYLGDISPSGGAPDLDANREASLCLELTTRCNYTCQNCFSESRRGAPGVALQPAYALAQLRSAAERKLRICVTGGEPLLYPAIESMLRVPASTPECGYVLCTNGTPRRDLDPLLIENQWVVIVSLHGREDTHNRYTAAALHRQAVSRVRDLAPHLVVHLAAVLHDEMEEADLDWLFRFRDTSGAAFLRLIVPRDHGRYVPLRDRSVLDHARRRLDERSALKDLASSTPFLGAGGEHRVTH